MQEKLDPQHRSHLASRVTWLGLVSNVLLSLFKILAGIFGRSEAMLADGFHSLSDLISDVVVLFGFKMVQKPVDKSHDYGHGRFETLSAVGIGVLLLFVASGLFYRGIGAVWNFFHGQYPPMPGKVALIMALFSIVVKEVLFRVTFSVGKKIKSQTIIANAWHHRSDMLSSVATFLGIGGAILLGSKWVILDPIAALLVSFMIFKVGIDILKDTLYELSDASLDDEIEDEILKIAGQIHGVHAPHNLKTRKLGATFAMDMDIRVDGNLSVYQGHAICTRVERALKGRFGDQIFVRIHMEPLKDDGHRKK